MPKVSVIIPTYNRAQTLQRAIQSVLRQTYNDWELVLVDDGSTDETPEVIKSYIDLPNIRAFFTSNRGVSAARNLGLKQARGEWIAFLDSDDEWLEDKLKLQIEFSQKYPNFDLIHGNEIWIRNGKRVNPMKKHTKSGGNIFADCLKLCCISPSTVMIKKKLLEAVGSFREDFPVCEDYDLWLRICHQQPVGYVEDFLIKKYGGHEDQLSRRLKAMDYWRICSIASLLSSGVLSESQKRCAQEELVYKAQILLQGYRKHENLVDYDQVFSIIN